MVYLPYSAKPDRARKPLHLLGSSRKGLLALPDPVRSTFGTLLLDIQYGETPPGAKPLSGFGGSRVLELVENHDTNTFRAVYTVHFTKAVYVLHVFQKKSKRGISTPRRDLDLIRLRFEAARHHYAEHYADA